MQKTISLVKAQGYKDGESTITSNEIVSNVVDIMLSSLDQSD